MKSEISVERLIARRRELGLTQAEAAEKIGVSQPAYQRYEAGVRTPSIQVVKEIANAFKVSIAYLEGDSDKMYPDIIVVDRNVDPVLFSIVEQCSSYDSEQLKRLLDEFRNLS